MLRNKALIALAALGVSVSGSTASAAPLMYGSDTLFNVATDAINNSGVSASFTYAGQGSGAGGAAMNAGNAVAPAHNQQIAPQSRFLSNAECGATSADTGNKGQGLEIGLDAIGIYRGTLGTTAATNCNTVRYTDAGGDGAALDPSFNITDWRDVLRVVYAGVFAGAKPETAASYNPCIETPPGRYAVAPIVGRCDAPARKSLIANWGKLFQESTCVTGNCPTGLRHAFRRDDLSGTTDVFLTLLALPTFTPNTQRPFCNGNDNEDLDIVRTPCDANEDVCEAVPYANSGVNPNGAAGAAAAASDPAVKGGDLGVVLAINMPTALGQEYSALACRLGGFGIANMPPALGNAAQCPDGTGRVLGGCRWPVGTGNIFGCKATSGNVPGVKRLLNMDGRVYNLMPRTQDTTGAFLLPPQSGTDVRWGGGGFYRIHETHVMANAGAGAVACKQNDATKQIGCLVQADPCSIGYSGRAALTWASPANNVSLNIRTPADTAVTNNAADDTAIRRLDLTQGGSAPGCNSDFGRRYALARTLWINSSQGFGQTAGGGLNVFTNIRNAATAGRTSLNQEQDFMTWVVANYNTPTTGMGAIISKYDFLPVTPRTFECASSTAALPLTPLN